MFSKQAQQQWFEQLFHTSLCFDVFHKVVLGINMPYFTQHTDCSCSIVKMERVCMWWEHFSSESEAFSLWINEKEKELEAVCSISSSESLDKHIDTVEVRSLSFFPHSQNRHDFFPS